MRTEGNEGNEGIAPLRLLGSLLLQKVLMERTRKGLCPQITQMNADEELFFSLRNSLNREPRGPREKSRPVPESF